MMKKLTIVCVLILLTIIAPAFIYSQSEPSAKQEFIYKTVKGHPIKATIFLPASKGKYPVFVYFHGGGFIFGNREQGLDLPLKEKLLANNYAVVSADYRLAPETKLGEILTDVTDVIKWLKQNGGEKYGIDTGKIATAGGSSGGYLAIAAGFNQKYAPGAIIAISAPTGFLAVNSPMGDTSVLHQPGPYNQAKDTIVSYGDYDTRMDLWRFLARNRLALYGVFGFDPSAEPEKLERFTLTSNIKTYFPPTLIIHARNDHLVDWVQATAFYNFLQEKKIISKLYLVDEGHSSVLINQNPAAVDEIISFLKERFQ